MLDAYKLVTQYLKRECSKTDIPNKQDNNFSIIQYYYIL